MISKLSSPGPRTFQGNTEIPDCARGESEESSMKATDYNGLKLMADVSRSLKRDTSGLTKRSYLVWHADQGAIKIVDLITIIAYQLEKIKIMFSCHFNFNINASDNI